MEFPLVLRKIQKKCVSGKRKIRRFLSKSGHLNLQLCKVPHSKYLRFSRDFANTLVALRWRWVTLLVILINFLFYLLFAGIWMLDAWLSGDFNGKTKNFCIKHSQFFTDYLQLSIETITTTGYGYLYPSEHCTLVWITLTLSTIVMIWLDGAFISVVFLKVCKPQRKDSLNMFSKKCVIGLRNGKLCLTFRVNDHLNKHAIDSKLDIFFIEEPEKCAKNFNVNLKQVQITSSGMFLWPTDVVHEIDENSPFWKMTASDFMNKKFEILVTFSGTSLVTNQSSVSQTSYLNKEILWGYRFKSCIEFHEKMKLYRINKEDIFKIIPCDTPLCSAETLKRIKDELRED